MSLTTVTGAERRFIVPDLLAGGYTVRVNGGTSRRDGASDVRPGRGTVNNATP